MFNIKTKTIIYCFVYYLMINEKLFCLLFEKLFCVLFVINKKLGTGNSEKLVTFTFQDFFLIEKDD